MFGDTIGINRFKRTREIEEIISFSPIVCEYFRSGFIEDGSLPRCFRIYSDGKVTIRAGKGEEYQIFFVSVQSVVRLKSLILKWHVYSLPDKLGNLFSSGFYEELSFFNDKSEVITNIKGGDFFYIGFHIITKYIYKDLIKPNLTDNMTVLKNLLDEEEVHDIIYNGLTINDENKP